MDKKLTELSRNLRITTDKDIQLQLNLMWDKVEIHILDGDNPELKVGPGWRLPLKLEAKSTMNVDYTIKDIPTDTE